MQKIHKLIGDQPLVERYSAPLSPGWWAWPGSGVVVGGGSQVVVVAGWWAS